MTDICTGEESRSHAVQREKETERASVDLVTFVMSFHGCKCLAVIELAVVRKRVQMAGGSTMTTSAPRARRFADRHRRPRPDVRRVGLSPASKVSRFTGCMNGGIAQALAYDVTTRV